MWVVLTVAEVVAIASNGEGGAWLLVGLSTLLFAGVHLQFWYEESERGRHFAHTVDRIRGRIYEDDTTGLPNSRHFVFELRRQMMRSVRNGKGFSLVLTDLNGLTPKEEAAALPTVGKALRHASYEGDFVAHLEGPVFAAVVVDDRDRTAADKADALFNALASVIPLDRANAVRPVVSLTGYQGELEVRDFLRRAQRDLLGARSRGTAPAPGNRQRGAA
jgi:GGDEF domain-containing protein